MATPEASVQARHLKATLTNVMACLNNLGKKEHLLDNRYSLILELFPADEQWKVGSRSALLLIVQPHSLEQVKHILDQGRYCGIRMFLLISPVSCEA